MLRILFALPLMVHGLAHLSGFLAAWTPVTAGYPEQPWIFSSNVMLSGSIGKIFGLLWLLSMAGLVGSGIGLLLRQEWWQLLALTGAILSLVVILPWWRAVPPGAWAGAVLDVLVILALATPIHNRIAELTG